jgi:thioredoxin-like negative regulator of GroEL
MLRRHFILAAALAALLGFGVARAATVANFDQAAFAAAQQAGKPILVHINASWCPTCAQQRPIIEKLSADPAFKNLMIFKVDFDSQKDVVKAMGVQMQSTMIVFHGTTEKGRATGDTNPDSIRALLAKSEG